jgi:hypothetical protein
MMLFGLAWLGFCVAVFVVGALMPLWRQQQGDDE